MQDEILAKHPDANLKIYSIWEPILPTDRRRTWKASLFSDPRITHYWDEERVSGQWYGDAVPNCLLPPVAWDAFYVYGPDAKWDSDAAKPIRCGAPVIMNGEALREALEPLLAK